MFNIIFFCLLFIYNTCVQGDTSTTTTATFLTEYTSSLTSTPTPTRLSTTTFTTASNSKPVATTTDISLHSIEISSAATREINCVSLRRSKVCTAFSQFYIGLPGLEYDFPFLINTTTIEEFDQRLLDYVNSTSDYLFPLGCLSSNYNPTVPYARWSLTRLCAGMIQNPTYSLPCNYENTLSPPPLCKNTCLDWVSSIENITANHRVCSDTSQRNNTLTSFHDQCETWAGYNGTIAENCISGIANEPYSCGFGNETGRACRYCKRHPDDICCEMVHNCGLSAGAIVGIVFGSLAGASFIVFGALWLYFKKRHRVSKPFHPFMGNSNSSTTNTTAINSDNHIPFTTTTSSSTIIATPATAGTLTKARNAPLINDKLEIIDTGNNHSSASSNTDSKLSTDGESTAAAATNTFNEEFYVVVHSYPPQMPDELQLNMGDIICIAFHFDDGWALGYNVTTGEKGAFPLVCISPAPEQSLDQLLQMDDAFSINSKNNRSDRGSWSNHPIASSAATTTAVNTPDEQSFMDNSNTTTTATTTNINSNNSTNLQLTMERIRESVRRSLSLNSYNIQHNNTYQLSHTNTFPKRSFSYNHRAISTSDNAPIAPVVANNYDYFETESPSSPTTHTPFFNYSTDHLQQNNRLQPMASTTSNNTSNISNTLHSLSSVSRSSQSQQQQRISMQRNNTFG